METRYSTVISYGHREEKRGPHTVGRPQRRRGWGLLRPRGSSLAPCPCPSLGPCHAPETGWHIVSAGVPNRLFNGYFDWAGNPVVQCAGLGLGVGELSARAVSPPRKDRKNIRKRSRYT